MPAAPPAAALWSRRPTYGLDMQSWRRVQQRALAQTGRAMLARENPKARRAPSPPAIEAVVNDPAVIRLIGQPSIARDGASPWPDDEAPSWIRLEEGATFPVLRLCFRGALVRTETRRALGERDNNVRAVDWCDSERLYDLEAMKEAVEAARQALRRAGVPLLHLAEIAQAHGGQSATAAIYLRALSPARSLGPTMAR